MLEPETIEKLSKINKAQATWLIGWLSGFHTVDISRIKS